MRLVNCLPRSLWGQLLVLWLLAVLAAHLVAVGMLTWWRAEHATIHPLSARAIETRIAASYRAVQQTPHPEPLLAALGGPDARFSLQSAPAVAAPGAAQLATQAGQIGARLREILQLPANVPVQVSLLQVTPDAITPDRRNWLERSVSGSRAWEMRVAIALPDGQWLITESQPSILPAHWDRVLSFSLLVGMIPTTLIALLFARKIMRPLRMLTDASRKVSRGEAVSLPPARGPDGVREIIQAFNDMQSSLVRYVQGRTQMVAAIGHDLRTPLTSLRIRAELVEDTALREAMVQTLDEMAAMVEGTLLFAQGEAQQDDFQDVGVLQLIEEVAGHHRLAGKQIVAQVSGGPQLLLRCRPLYIKRALTNLVDNAARYGEVRISAGLGGEGKQLFIEICDSGPGIAEAQLENVFEPFVRLDQSRHKDSGGFGLGLPIARSCIRAHGGEIRLRNDPQGGLCVLIELPC